MSAHRNLYYLRHLYHLPHLVKSGLPFLSVICLLLFIITSAMTSAQAVPCFDNPQAAYQYLLAKEQLDIQAQTQTGVNINRASEGELTSLNGIGSSKAQAIILYREMFGDFQSVDELAKVKGIGAKTIEKNRSRLQVRD